MNDLYLKFKDKAEAEAVLIEAGFTRDEESKAIYHPECAVDVIGLFYDSHDTGTVDAEGFPIYTPTQIDGWHVNVRALSDVAIPAEYCVTPESPRRVWI